MEYLWLSWSNICGFNECSGTDLLDSSAAVVTYMYSYSCMGDRVVAMYAALGDSFTWTGTPHSVKFSLFLMQTVIMMSAAVMSINSV